MCFSSYTKKAYLKENYMESIGTHSLLYIRSQRKRLVARGFETEQGSEVQMISCNIFLSILFA